MATTGMFDWNPKSQLQLQQEYLQGIIGDNPDSSYRMGAEIGASLGRLFGGRTAQEAEQNIMKDVFSQAAQEQDPVKRLQTAAALFRQKGMEGRAQQLEAQLLKQRETEAEIKYKEAQAAPKAPEDKRTNEEKIAATMGILTGQLESLKAAGQQDTPVYRMKEVELQALQNSAAGKDKSTGPERMVATVTQAQVKLASGQPLTDAERLAAANTADYLSKMGQFQDKDGNIVSVDKNYYRSIADSLRSGQQPTQAQPPVSGQQPAMSTGQAAPSPVLGRTVTPTPYSEGLKKKEVDAIEMSIQGINDALLAGEPLKQLAPSGVIGATWSALSSTLPWSDARAMNNYVQSIKSQKTLDTLQQLKNQSKTGATGFGSLTEKELNLIDARVRVLDPLSKTFKEDLNYVLKGFADIRDKLSKERNSLSGVKEAGPSTKQEVLIQDTMSKNPNKTREQVIQGLKKLGVI